MCNDANAIALYVKYTNRERLPVVFPDIRYIKMFVLDEADEMLSRGFKDQIYDVFRTLNENIQVGAWWTNTAARKHTIHTSSSALSILAVG